MTAGKVAPVLRRPCGLRVKHPTLRAVKLLVPDPVRKLPDGSPKQYPITLDREGYGIVSETVWDRLQQCRNAHEHKLIITNRVTNPPAQIIATTDQLPNRHSREDPVYRQEGDRILRILRDLGPTPPGVLAVVTTRW